MIDVKGPNRILVNLDRRLSQTELMGFLKNVISPFVGDIIVDRFAYSGDATVGMWPSLAAYTERLKKTLGAPANAPNERTGDLMYHLAYEHAVEPWVGGALLRIPGSSDDWRRRRSRPLRRASQHQPTRSVGRRRPAPYSVGASARSRRSTSCSTSTSGLA